jgi:hypothetical protein
MTTGTNVITREELYELVWSTPMIKVAEKFEVSGSYLARVCTELRVPRPEPGYWAKLAVGKAPQRPALPEPLSGHPVVWSRTDEYPTMVTAYCYGRRTRRCPRRKGSFLARRPCGGRERSIALPPGCQPRFCKVSGLQSPVSEPTPPIHSPAVNAVDTLSGRLPHGSGMNWCQMG